MAFRLLRRFTIPKSTVHSYLLFCHGKVSLSKASLFLRHDRGYSVSNRLHLSPLFPAQDSNCTKDIKIQLMDNEAWQVSSCLADSWKGNELKMKPIISELENEGGDGDMMVNSVVPNTEDLDFDEIEDMRIRGNLFYKLDKDSKEYQEYIFDFHRRKSPKNKKDSKEKPSRKSDSNVEKTSKPDEQKKNKKTKEYKSEALFGRVKDEPQISRVHDMGEIEPTVEKKERTLTFNQQTAAYHEPFCLDIYISKGSVRAGIIHRATSNVVVVAHSISKDMKFELSSTKNNNACVSVGEVLAQRALEEDIYNVVYTPRKGEKLEGKLQIVLNSVINGGVNVKVKLKQKEIRKAEGFLPRRT